MVWLQFENRVTSYILYRHVQNLGKKTEKHWLALRGCP